MNPRMLRLTQNIQKYEVTCSTPPPAPDQKPQSTSSPVPNATTMMHIMLKYFYRHFGNRCLSKIFESYLEIPREIYIFQRSFKDIQRHPGKSPSLKDIQRYPKPPEDLWKYCNYLKCFRAKGLFLMEKIVGTIEQDP